MKPHQKLLHEYLQDKKKINPRFSLRSFARLMQMSPSQLSSLMNGKKDLTKKIASKIIENLKLDHETSMEILTGLVPDASIYHTEPIELKVLTSDEFTALSNWYYYAILGLANLNYNQANPDWIAQKLSLDEETCKKALLRLIEMGIVKTQEDGSFIQVIKNLTSTADIPSDIIKRAHVQNLQMAISKIEDVPINLREYSSITMSADIKKIAKIKRMITEFKHKLCGEFNKGSATEVYTLSIQLFPLTKIGEP